MDDVDEVAARILVSLIGDPSERKDNTTMELLRISFDVAEAFTEYSIKRRRKRNEFPTDRIGGIG